MQPVPLKHGHQASRRHILQYGNPYTGCFDNLQTHEPFLMTFSENSVATFLARGVMWPER